MRLGRILIILAIIVILILVAAYVVLNLQGNGGEQGPINTTDVVILLQPVERGQTVTAEMLGFLAYPTEQTIEPMFTDPSEVVGRLARFDLDGGLVLTESMLVGDGSQLSTTGSDQALLIPAGMVAFPIPIDRFSSVAYGLRDGDSVNVISTLLMVDLDQSFQSELPNHTGAVIGPGQNVIITIQEGESISSEIITSDLINALTAQIATGGAVSPQGRAESDPVLNQPFYLIPSESQRPRLVSQTVLQNITILHVGNYPYTDENGDLVENAYQPATTAVDAEGNPVSAGPKPPPDIVTLIVTPQDAVTLNYLIYAGADLSLALRGSGDDSTVEIDAVTLEYLLETYDIPLPNRLPYGLDPRIDEFETPDEQTIDQ
jgi:pilus assembly protein CpaB